jgi:flagellar basal-body rod protein FlgC
MDSAMNIAASGMRAAALSLDSAASNIANMHSNGPVPATPPNQSVPPQSGAVYQATTVQQTPAPGGGVSAALQDVQPSYVVAYDPNSSFANSQGLIADPNVDAATQFVNMIQARTAFTASLAVFEAADTTYKSLLDVLA